MGVVLNLSISSKVGTSSPHAKTQKLSTHIQLFEAKARTESEACLAFPQVRGQQMFSRLTFVIGAMQKNVALSQHSRLLDVVAALAAVAHSNQNQLSVPSLPMDPHLYAPPPPICKVNVPLCQ